MDQFYKSPSGNYVNIKFADPSLQGGKIYSASDAGLATSAPVSVLSTANAADTVDKNLSKLNNLYPVSKNTTPTLTAKDGSVPSDMSPKAPIVPKATYTNAAGQNASYTDEQLKDPTIQKFLTDNSYVLTNTEGPTYTPGGAPTQAGVTAVDDRISQLANDFMSYNVDQDPGFQSQAANIKANFAKLKAEMEKSNASRASALQTIGFRTGASQYAGGVQSSVEGAELDQANQRIADLNLQESNAIAAARTAYQTGKYSLFTQQMNILDKVRENKAAALKAYNETLATALKNVKSGAIQASRDGAIADLLNQGVSDAAQILQYLNYDEKGNLIGDFTAKEVSDTLSSFAKNSGLGDLAKLTGEVKNFAILKESGALPSNIESLPEQDQLAAYLQFIKPKKALGVTSPGSTNKITLSEAKSQGLPLSVVGMSENEVAASFGSATPPKWFVEKAQGEAQASIIPEKVQSLWDDYRSAYEANRGKSSSSSTTVTKDNYKPQAETYFKGTFGDQLKPEDLATLVDRVGLYMQGGYTYKAAVAATVKDATGE